MKIEIGVTMESNPHHLGCIPKRYPLHYSLKLKLMASEPILALPYLEENEELPCRIPFASEECMDSPVLTVTELFGPVMWSHHSPPPLSLFRSAPHSLPPLRSVAAVRLITLAYDTHPVRVRLSGTGLTSCRTSQNYVGLRHATPPRTTPGRRTLPPRGLPRASRHAVLGVI